MTDVLETCIVKVCLKKQAATAVAAHISLPSYQFVRHRAVSDAEQDIHTYGGKIWSTCLTWLHCFSVHYYHSIVHTTCAQAALELTVYVTLSIF